MKSYFELDLKETNALYLEFKKIPGGKEAHHIWVMNNIIGVIISGLNTILLFLSFFLWDVEFLKFIFLTFLLLGIFIVYSATKEFYQKYNSWLRIQKKVVRD